MLRKLLISSLYLFTLLVVGASQLAQESYARADLLHASSTLSGAARLVSGLPAIISSDSSPLGLTPTASLTPTATGTPGCELAWREVASPNRGPLSDWLNGVSAIAVNDAWAVGYSVTETGYGKKTLVEHWNGAQWEVVSSPNIGGDPQNQLRAVAALAPDDVWAVGHYMGPFAITHTLVEHWDGSQWSVVPSPDGRSGGNHLNGVWALSADDVWAVGNSNEFTDVSPQTMILHWDGTHWEVVPSPNIGSRTNSLTSITGTAHNDVWAAGYYYDVSSGVTYTMLQHWDGTEWKLVLSPNAGAANVLQGIYAVAPDDVWAVGYYTASGATYTLVLHWNGKVWEIVPSPSIGSFSQLNSVSGSATGDLWAAGYYFDGERSRTLILHWNGSTWSIEPSPDPAEATSTLTGVSAVSAGDVWVVGESHPSGAGARTLTARYSSSCATPVPTSTALVTPTACSLSFTDVPPGSTFYPYVRCLSCMGVISGYSSGCEAGSPCFRVSNSVTRGQLTKIVSNAAGFSDPPGVQLFEDVPAGHAFYSYIQRLASRGYTGGYRCGSPGEPCVPPGSLAYFRPGSDVTRGQLAKIVSTAAGFGGMPGFQLFEDVPPSHAFFTDTQMLGRRWIMDGYLCGTPGEPCLPPYGRRYFRPANSATRGQTSKIVSNTFFPGCNPP